jgi:hypothetical protein
LEDGTNEAWEALCTRCGTSCHFAVPVNGLPVVVPGLRCRFLVFEEGGQAACSVYEERFERAPWCMSAEEAVRGGLVGQSCAYARGVRGYRGKVRLSDRLMAKVAPAIRAHVMEYGVPVGCSVEGLRAWLAESGGGRFEIVEDPDESRLRVVPLEE